MSDNRKRIYDGHDTPVEAAQKLQIIIETLQNKYHINDAEDYLLAIAKLKDDVTNAPDILVTLDMLAIAKNEAHKGDPELAAEIRLLVRTKQPKTPQVSSHQEESALSKLKAPKTEEPITPRSGRSRD